MSAHQDDISKLPVIPSGEQHFRLLSSSQTDFCCDEIPNAAMNPSHDVLCDPMEIFNPTSHDWTFENDITRSLLLDIAIFRTSLEANQAGLIISSSSNVNISHESAVSFLSESSFTRFNPKIALLAILQHFSDDILWTTAISSSVYPWIPLRSLRIV
jgi:hypothetical protein